MTLTVVCLAKIVGKNRRHAVGGRLRLTDEARCWMQLIADETALAVRAQGWRDPGGPLALTIRHSASRHDVDAPIPLVMDAVAAGLGLNDRRFARVLCERASVAEIGGLGVKVEVAGMAVEVCIPAQTVPKTCGPVKAPRNAKKRARNETWPYSPDAIPAPDANLTGG